MVKTRLTNLINLNYMHYVLIKIKFNQHYWFTNN